MDSARLKQLLTKYKAGEYTEAEAAELLRYLHDADNRITLAQLAAEGLFDESHHAIIEDSAVQERLNMLFDKLSSTTNPQPRKLTPWKYLPIAVALLAALVVGFYFWRNSQIEHVMMVKAENGEVKEVVLPDSSHAWLNAGATLSYPKRFRRSDRTVTLTDGQAFFEVKRNEDKPFIVQAGALNVQVLGTAFEVTAYDNKEQASVAVQSGKVNVSTHQAAISATTVTANQKATVNTTSGMVETSEIDGDDIAGWKDNRLVFFEEPFANVVEALQRRYGTRITVNKASLLKDKVILKLDDQPLDQVLKVLSISNDFNYEFANDNTIIIH